MTNNVAKENILILRFKNKIYQSEVSQFRGAINDVLKEKSILLFHNHEGDSFRYAYPLIQYKRINQCAAMVCLNEGTEAIGHLLIQGNFSCRLGDRMIELEVDGVKANQFLIQIWNSLFTYRLRKWLALNQDNYSEYQKLDGISEKCLFLEKVLIGNILSFAKGLDIHFDKEVTCKIINIEEPKQMKYKNVNMMAFDIEFKTNVSIPDYVGLGKGASLGFGMVTRKYEEKQNK